MIIFTYMRLFYPSTLTQLVLGLCLVSCSKSSGKNEGRIPFKEGSGLVLSQGFPGEVSGIADSYSQPGTIWMIEDGDNPAQLLRVTHDGELQAAVNLPTAENRDWEALAIGPGPENGKKYLYIAETGDNEKKYSEYAIYRLQEPAAGIQSVDQVDKLRFTYGDNNPHDAEALMIDPITKDLIILTKEVPSKIFTLRYPHDAAAVQVAEESGVSRIAQATAGDISPDGTEVLLRNYTSVMYWKKQGSETIQSLLQTEGVEIPVKLEPQGEAISFKTNAGGFFTLSENGGLPIQLRLYFYQRN